MSLSPDGEPGARCRRGADHPDDPAWLRKEGLLNFPPEGPDFCVVILNRLPRGPGRARTEPVTKALNVYIVECLAYQLVSVLGQPADRIYTNVTNVNSCCSVLTAAH